MSLLFDKTRGEELGAGVRRGEVVALFRGVALISNWMGNMFILPGGGAYLTGGANSRICGVWIHNNSLTR